ncbi:MAG TPA: transcription termination/antitermination NusG family protein [Blastocatellia bacterium]|nr:transcription termination/antitermination NusG family protein [Blastocatellia bacterium]
MVNSSEWFALQTKPRCEKTVEYALTRKGYECLLPTYQKNQVLSLRTVKATLPLFPTYIFCRFNQEAVGKAILTPGVRRIVGFGGRPAALQAKEISALQKLAKTNLLRRPWLYVPEGTLVQIKTGPLSGVEGLVSMHEKREHLIITVSLLQQSVIVQLDENIVFSVIKEPKRPTKRKTDTDYDYSDVALKLLK